MNNEFVRILKETIVTYSRLHHGICTGGTEEYHEDSRRSGRDFPTTSADRYRCTNLLGPLMDSIRKKLNADRQILCSHSQNRFKFQETQWLHIIWIKLPAGSTNRCWVWITQWQTFTAMLHNWILTSQYDVQLFVKPLHGKCQLIAINQ